MPWYKHLNLGGFAGLRGYQAGGPVFIPNDAGAVSGADLAVNPGGPSITASTPIIDNVYRPDLAPQAGGYEVTGTGDFGGEVIDPYALAQPEALVTNYDGLANVNPYEAGSGQFQGADYQVATDPLINAHQQGYTFTDPVNPANPQDNSQAELQYTAPEDAVFAPPAAVPSVGTANAINSGATGNPANVVGSYIGGGGAPGVNTGIPQGGHAAPAIAQYFAGTNVPQLSYNNPQTSSAVDTDS